MKASKSRSRWLVAGLSLTSIVLVVGPASGLEKCKAKLVTIRDTNSGTRERAVLLSAADVQGPLMWGYCTGAEDNPVDLDTKGEICVDLAKGVAKNCTLAETGEAKRRLLPSDCAFALSDGVSTCTALLGSRNCTEGLRSLSEANCDGFDPNEVTTAAATAATALATATTAQTTASTAQTAANAAQSTANTAQTTATAAQSTANTANTTATAAQTTANTASTTATAAQSTANTAQSTANTAQTTASSAQTTATAAQSTANTAQTTATAAQTTASTAQSAANTAQTTATAAQTTANAAQATANTAQTTATSAQAAAAQNSTEIQGQQVYIQCLQVGGRVFGQACWFAGLGGCSAVCSSHGGFVYDDTTRTFAGSGGSAAQCAAVLDNFPQTVGAAFAPCPTTGPGDPTNAVGCAYSPPDRRYCVAEATTATADNGYQRICACKPAP